MFSITGASSGIGRATALLFAKHKYQLSLTGRNEAALKDVAKECVQQGITENDVVISPTDLAADNAPKAIVHNTLGKFQRIDSLVNSAGILRAGPVLDSDISVYDELFNVNFPGVTYYCMSKSAVDQFTKCLALEMAPHGVRVNAVNPGVTVTNLHRRSGQDETAYAAFLEKSKSTHALGRPGDPREVAEAILFLASEKSSFTTGQLLRVDGGASSGIGQAVSIRLAREGYALSLSGRDQNALMETVEQCKSAGAEKVIITVGDLCDDSNAERLVDNTVKEYQRIDTLVNSAGILVSGNVLDAGLDLYDRQMDVNVPELSQLIQVS
ncbi:oxidoreductase, short chain dehydrogenase/reductase family protein [Ancylostoma duodenale]|uniref:Oxidoreductase, short chain dehydrogenase/reductase family protein n=2 Tax=Ancylostoma TaxID=29169 RepID=A0A0C2G2A8_9BILA|nr:oxidoreductase, short chain dehydrogenase/reductase family protein [Ancylostoma duodenale]